MATTEAAIWRKIYCGCEYRDPYQEGDVNIRISPDCHEHGNAPAPKTEEKPFFITRLVYSTKQGFARRGLEKKLEFNLNAARAHENNGVPAGHRYYKLLYNGAIEALNEFAENHVLTEAQKNDSEKKAAAMEDLRSQFPAVHVLFDLARASEPRSERSAGLGAKIVGVVLASPVLIGVGYGIFHWVTRLLGVN